MKFFFILVTCLPDVVVYCRKKFCLSHSWERPRQGVRQFSSRLIPTFGEFHHIVRNDEFITAVLQNGQWCKVNNTDF